MNNFLILLKKDLLEIKRTKKWLVYLLVFSIVTIFSVVNARLLPELFNLVLQESEMEVDYQIIPSVADSYVQFIANIGEIVFLVIAIMFSTTLLKEKLSGTYYLLKSNGVSETKIVLSHFVSKLILITVGYLISIIIFIPLNLILFKEYTGIRGFVALTYLYVTLIFALSLGLFISSVVTKKSNGYAFAIVAYFLLTIIGAFPYIDLYIPIYSLTLATETITNVEYQLSDYLINMGMNLVIITALVAGSIYMFKNKIDNRK